MLANVKSVWSVIVRCDLDGKFYAIANVLNERVTSPVIAFPNLMRNDQLCVRVDARPEPIIPALCLVVFRKSASVTADVLPLFIHLDSDARQITKVFVHIIRECFAGVTNDAKHGMFSGFEHACNRIDRRAFAECRQN